MEILKQFLKIATTKKLQGHLWSFLTIKKIPSKHAFIMFILKGCTRSAILKNLEIYNVGDIVE